MEGIHRQATLLFVLNSKLYQEIPPPSWKSSETEVVYALVERIFMVVVHLSYIQTHILSKIIPKLYTNRQLTSRFSIVIMKTLSDLISHYKSKKCWLILGYALCPIFSLLNHSCMANCRYDMAKDNSQSPYEEFYKIEICKVGPQCKSKSQLNLSSHYRVFLLTFYGNML